jgi:hypothetical protein
VPETREVLVHLNIEVPDVLDDDAAKAAAVAIAVDAANQSVDEFMKLVALIDPT